jgi:hypothetical protein
MINEWRLDQNVKEAVASPLRYHFNFLEEGRNSTKGVSLRQPISSLRSEPETVGCED